VEILEEWRKETTFLPAVAQMGSVSGEIEPFV
jgi:hypothetical protein